MSRSSLMCGKRPAGRHVVGQPNRISAGEWADIVGKAVQGDTSKLLRQLAADAAKAKLAEDEKLDKPTKLVKAYLQKNHPAAAERGALSPLTDADLAKAFPKATFYLLRFRQYPVAFEVPEGLSAGNICVLQGEEVSLVSDDKGLQAFFSKGLPAVMSHDDRRQAAKAWLRIAQELHNDGFYRFKPLAEEKVTLALRQVSGVTHVDPQGGNKGQISAVLTFYYKGKLAKGQSKAELSPGIRPICQSTKPPTPTRLSPHGAARSGGDGAARRLGYLLSNSPRPAPTCNRRSTRCGTRSSPRGGNDSPLARFAAENFENRAVGVAGRHAAPERVDGRRVYLPQRAVQALAGGGESMSQIITSPGLLIAASAAETSERPSGVKLMAPMPRNGRPATVRIFPSPVGEHDLAVVAGRGQPAAVG